MAKLKDVLSGRKVAEKLNISETSVRRATERGELFRIKKGKYEGKYDITDPRNVAGMQSILDNVQCGDKRPRPKKTTIKKKPAKRIIKETESILDIDISEEKEFIDLDIVPLDSVNDIGSLNLLKKREEIKEKRLKNQETRGDLVDRKNVAKIFNKLWSVDTSQFQTLGTKISPDIASICGIDDQVKIAKVRERIDKEIFKITLHCQRIMSEYLAKINAGTIEGEE